MRIKESQVIAREGIEKFVDSKLIFSESRDFLSEGGLGSCRRVI